MISIVNVKKEPCTHFCGRASSYIPTEHGVDLTVLGNPFKTKNFPREDCIEMYGEYLWGMYNRNEPSLMDVMLLLYNEKGEKRLGCFCKPRRCHCDYILEIYDDFCFKKLCY